MSYRGYPWREAYDLFTTLDGIREMRLPRLVSCSADYAWFTPWWVWGDNWYCPWECKR